MVPTEATAAAVGAQAGALEKRRYLRGFMPPNNLAIYLSNRCNLDCRYCYVAVNQGEPHYLCFGQIKDAVDRFLNMPSQAEKKISFLGGEPLLRWGVLEESIRYARNLAESSIIIQIFTNGTELSRERFDFLMEHDVEVTLSLDGPQEINDLNRPFYRRSGSPFKKTMEKIKSFPKSRLGVNMVFTTQTVDRLLSDIEFFRQKGFGRISFTPDLNEPWPEEKINHLRCVMEGFRRYYALLVDKGAPIFAIANLYAILEKTTIFPGRSYWWEDCHNLVVGADGGFYACDKSLGFDFAKVKPDKVGDVKSGVEWEKRESLYQEARAAVISEVKDGNAFTSCPMGIFFVKKALGKDPGKALSNFEAVSKAYGDPLLKLALDLWENRTFREFHAISDGAPKPRIAAEIGMATISL